MFDSNEQNINLHSSGGVAAPIDYQMSSLQNVTL